MPGMNNRLLVDLARLGNRDSSPLTRVQFVSEFQMALSQAGTLSEGFTGHSFYRGAATTAAAQGWGTSCWANGLAQGIRDTFKRHGNIWQE